MKVSISTPLSLIVLAALLLLLAGCSGRSHMARVPNYSNMTDSVEVQSSADNNTPLASVPDTASGPGNSPLNVPWYYVVPVFALCLLGAAIVIKKRSGQKQAEMDEPTVPDAKEDSAEPNDNSGELTELSDTGDLDEFELTDPHSSWSQDGDELELDSVILLNDEEPTRNGAMTDNPSSATASQTNGVDEQSSIEQLKRENEIIRDTLEAAVTKIGKLKTKLREKIRLVERLQSTANELSEETLTDISPEQLKEKLQSVNSSLQLALEKIDYTSARNLKLKTKLREKVDLIEVLRGVQEVDLAAEEMEGLSEEALRKRLLAIQKERADLKAELEHARDWNAKLKSKLREKLAVIEDLSDELESSDSKRNGQLSTMNRAAEIDTGRKTESP